MGWQTFSDPKLDMFPNFPRFSIGVLQALQDTDILGSVRVHVAHLSLPILGVYSLPVTYTTFANEAALRSGPRLGQPAAPEGHLALLTHAQRE